MNRSGNQPSVGAQPPAQKNPDIQASEKKLAHGPYATAVSRNGAPDANHEDLYQRGPLNIGVLLHLHTSFGFIQAQPRCMMLQRV